MKYKIHFGTVIIDKLHQFFGKSNPIACVVSSAWESEKEDGENQEVWIEHYRGHYKETFKNLRNTTRYEVTDKVIDCKKNVLAQLKEIEKNLK